MIDATGNWYLPFLMSMGLLLLGGFSAFLMHPERPFTGAEGRLPSGQGGGRGVGKRGRTGRRLCMGGALRRGDKPVKWCYSAAIKTRLDREGRR